MTESEKKELQVSNKKAIEKTSGEPTREGVTFVPDVDITESGEAITLYADLPGAEKEGLNIDVREGVLTLTATVKPVEKNHRLIYHEYDIGGFTRRFTLGEQIDQNRIEASLNNGILKLVLHKAEAAKPRKIKVS
jgi:HSP20 family protein